MKLTDIRTKADYDAAHLAYAQSHRGKLQQMGARAIVVCADCITSALFIAPPDGIQARMDLLESKWYYTPDGWLCPSCVLKGAAK